MMRSMLLFGLVAGLLVAPALCARAEPAETDDQPRPLRTLLSYKSAYYTPKQIAVTRMDTKTEGDAKAYANGYADSDKSKHKTESYSDALSKSYHGGKSTVNSQAVAYIEDAAVSVTDTDTYAKNDAEAYADGYAEVGKHEVYAGGHAYSDSDKYGEGHASVLAVGNNKPSNMAPDGAPPEPVPYSP